MSTILEALKKSEQERKLNRLPTLSDMPPPQEKSNLPMALLVVICLLLLIILGFLGLQWWRTDKKGALPAAYTAEKNVALSSVPASPQDSEILVNVVSYAEDPLQRFAIIDGKMVRENEFVRPGLRVEKIEADAVYLILRGERIKRTL